MIAMPARVSEPTGHSTAITPSARRETIRRWCSSSIVSAPSRCRSGPHDRSARLKGRAVAASAWILRIGPFTDGKSVVTLPRSTIFGAVDLHSQRTYYLVCLVVLVAVATLLRRVRAGGLGRRIVAVRYRAADGRRLVEIDLATRRLRVLSRAGENVMFGTFGVDPDTFVLAIGTSGHDNRLVLLEQPATSRERRVVLANGVARGGPGCGHAVLSL